MVMECERPHLAEDFIRNAQPSPSERGTDLHTRGHRRVHRTGKSQNLRPCRVQILYLMPCSVTKPGAAQLVGEAIEHTNALVSGSQASSPTEFPILKRPPRWKAGIPTPRRLCRT